MSFSHFTFLSLHRIIPRGVVEEVVVVVVVEEVGYIFIIFLLKLLYKYNKFLC